MEAEILEVMLASRLWSMTVMYVDIQLVVWWFGGAAERSG